MPVGTPQETGLAQCVEKVRMLAARHAQDADRDRAPHPEVVDALREAGFARHFVAAELGGAQGSFTDLGRAVVAVGEECGSTAWCASLTANSARLAAHLPREGQRTVWADGPDTMVSAGLIPSGRATPADGGWQLAGRWDYVSGVDFADWVLLCAAVPDPDRPPHLRFFALPRASCRTLPTWDAVGMAATGSHTVVVEDSFVPGHLSFDRAEVLTGRNAASSADAHNVPFPAVAGLTFVTPAVGAALGALRAAGTLLTGKRRTPGKEVALARAAGLIESARQLTEQNAAAVDARDFAAPSLARSERNSASAAELAADAVWTLVRLSGTGGLSLSHPLQRYWRDVVTATSHTALRYETSAGRSYAAALLGPADAGPAEGPRRTAN
ncbi:acyl-CoA dehydrogenase family protein [Streptomyces candidus]|uniref:Alkylation response protein AidB-like acyl-CoA dehydrogenase n=1 Tax=Streptomyces candidus TaxID=67283 RepID=A0A7X0LQ52_9ACTN|nr:hydrolase [Streptomyces candidus]MBB6436677.1 alkylation response protein AidB-like acyl-CoA dehydrogenase [Streptomyces candidus]GHH51026.1 hydrolase [Streptomyces candidus]